MSLSLTRREILKLLSLMPAGFNLPASTKRQATSAGASNVLVIVFDAFSATNIPFYGYPRDTTPHITRLLEQAIVYHNHYAGGPFTTPGTASLLTGSLPWSHRANKIHNEVVPPYDKQNIFSEFSNAGYSCHSYTHNPLAGTLLHQFGRYIDQNTPRRDLMIRTGWGTGILPNDSDLMDILQRNIIHGDEGILDSLFIAEIIKKAYDQKRAEIESKYKDKFPEGVPRIGLDDYFTLETSVDWLKANIGAFQQPFLGYYHFIPPHGPYKTRQEFINLFKDELSLPHKPTHILGKGSPQEIVDLNRQKYDHTIAYVDAEFNRLFKFLKQSGLLENTWVVLTSDHGELFERGIIGHSTDTLYQAGIRIPLVIFEPGRTRRADVYDNTSAIDLLPTLMHLSGQRTPDWAQGQLLPPYNKTFTSADVFTVMARLVPPGRPLNRAVFSMVRGHEKLIHYRGIEEMQGDDRFEFYNLEDDPQELDDRYSSGNTAANQMKDTLLANLEQADRPYVKNG